MISVRLTKYGSLLRCLIFMLFTVNVLPKLNIEANPDLIKLNIFLYYLFSSDTHQHYLYFFISVKLQPIKKLYAVLTSTIYSRS